MGSVLSAYVSSYTFTLTSVTPIDGFTIAAIAYTTVATAAATALVLTVSLPIVLVCTVPLLPVLLLLPLL